MLNRPRNTKEMSCLFVRLNEDLRKMAKNPMSRTPAINIRDEVRNNGGQRSSVHFPSEKTVDQVAYIIMIVKIDMRCSIQTIFIRVKRSLSYSIM